MIHWGILGAGNIAHRFAASLRHQPDSVLEAVACRSSEKGRAFTSEYPARTVYTDYAALLADSDVDAIYLALPHSLHAQWALKAIAAGKAVLCEKPAVLSAREMREIIEASRRSHVLFMEAMKSRFVPLYEQVREQLASGVIGTLTAIETSFCNDIPFDKMGPTYHTQPGQGGALLDGGTYCASWLEAFLPGDPTLTQIAADLKNGIDFYLDAALRFADKTARLECAFDRAKPKQAVLRGTKGTITVDDLHRPQSMTICVQGAAPRTVTAPCVVDDFYGQIDHFVKLLEAGKSESDIMPLAASLRCAKILDTIRAGFTYTPRCLEVLQEQENILQYEHFGNAEVMALGNAAAELAAQYDRGVGVSIVRESDGLELFRYMMADKNQRNLLFIEGKRQAALASGHCSLWPYVEHELTGRWQELFDGMPKTLPCAGAFPIRVKGEWVATLTVSGLHEGKDHELLVRALSKVLGKKVPVFPSVSV